MKYSTLFGKTNFGEQSGSQFPSHQLLTKGGFIRESTAGRYYFLPLGWRVHEKIRSCIAEEMNAAGAQEMLAPTLHPLELWQETNRTDTVGFELMTIQDQRGAEFALGGTAEEMFVDLVRKLNLTYKDLPFNIYQFSNKFRDEKRARGGLLRVREFIMKDAYSFHCDAADFQHTYEQMAATYSRIFERLGVPALQVAADNGYIGGEYCHEFQVESELGEGRFFVSEDGEYCAHEDIATFQKPPRNLDETARELTSVAAERGTTMEDGAQLHGLPLWQQMKDVLYVDEKGRFILAVLLGHLEVNETKLKHVTGSVELRHATEEEIREIIHSEPGFISPVGIRELAAEGTELLIIGDDSLRTVRNAYGGANHAHLDLLNIQIDRDYTLDQEADIAMAQDGFLAPNGSVLRERKGIEVGNIFQLGYHYTEKMKGALFIDQDGKGKPFYMGCYGIGLGRTMAAIVEKHHDDRGIIWPAAIAPFQIHLISLRGGEAQAAELYQTLTEHGAEVLWDERDESPGRKFSDADLIGCPIRLVVSARTAGKVEWRLRTQTDSELISVVEVLKRVLV